MSVPSTTNKHKYEGDGVETSFNYDFKITNKTYVKVLKIDTNASPTTTETLTVDIDYSVSGVGNDNGGDVTYPLSGSPLADGEFIVLKPNYPYSQGVRLRDQGGFSPEVHEGAFDHMTMLIKQNKEQVDRAVALTDASEDDPDTLLTNIENASTYATQAQTAKTAAETAQGHAETAQAAAEAAAAGLDLPNITGGDALKTLRVNSGETGYELATVGTAGTGTLRNMNIGDGVENDGSSNLRVKIDGTTLTRSASGIKVDDDQIGADQLIDTAVVSGSYTNTNLTVDAQGRITAAASGSPGITSVSQGDLNTSSGTFSLSVSNATAVSFGSNEFTIPSSSSSHVIMPGGQYGFTPLSDANVNTIFSGWLLGNDTTTAVLGAKPYVIHVNAISNTVYGFQRYVTASPPFDMGDGDAQGFLFLLLDKRGQVQGHYMADVPPWGYNGPTDIMADGEVLALTGLKYRRKRDNKNNVDRILKGKKSKMSNQCFKTLCNDRIKKEVPGVMRQIRNALSKETFSKTELRLINDEKDRVMREVIQDHYEPITQDIKNADMNLLPTPFRSIDTNKFTAVMIDPMDEHVADLITEQNLGGAKEIKNAINKGLIYTVDDELKRSGPQGVKITPLKFK